MSKIGVAFALRKMGAATWAALTDRRVPFRLKLIAIAATLFVLSPLNVFGDVPLLGFFDDAALLGFVLMWFTRASARYQNTFDM